MIGSVSLTQDVLSSITTEVFFSITVNDFFLLQYLQLPLGTIDTRPHCRLHIQFLKYIQPFSVGKGSCDHQLF